MATEPSKGADTAAPSRSEQSVQAFREALEATVTIPRERLQDAVDDAVRRGRMTRRDAEELVDRLVTRSRQQADDILGQLEDVVTQLRDDAGRQRRSAARKTARARRELEDAADKARDEVGSRAETARKQVVGAVDTPLAAADRARRKARVPGFPISAYDQLSIRQVDSRLGDLSRDELRKVRDYERAHKARKGLLRSIDRRLKG